MAIQKQLTLDEEIEKTIEYMRKHRERMAKSKAVAKAFLKQIKKPGIPAHFYPPEIKS